ncbi:MAG: heavy metal translocating P-type ATPase [Desulfovibrio sp.]|nr:heavy metal translocating P-type ATPase [Desulfovibrio sp.]
MSYEKHTVRLSVQGMTCGACSARVQRVASMQAGIAGADVSLPAATAELILDDALDDAGRRQAVDAVLQAIANAGFTASLASRQADARATWEARQQDMARELEGWRRRLMPAFAFTIPLFIISMGEMVGLPMPALLSPHHHPLSFALVQLALVAPVVWTGRQYYVSGISKLLAKAPNMDSLIALGTGAAVVYSCWNTLEIALGVDPMQRAMDLYFEGAAVIITLVSLGKYFELRSRMRTSSAIKSLLQLTPEQATRVLAAPGEDVLTTASTEVVSVEQVRPGDVLLVKSGERVPVDGEIVAGEAALDESMLTGESLPVTKSIGDAVAGGTVSVQGSLRMRATRVGEETVLSRIIALVQQAQGSRAPVANLADRISLYFVPIVMGIAVVSGLAWLAAGEPFSMALRICISVLVIACPCAMGLATPTSIMVGTGRGAQLGVLFKNGLALEQTGRVEVLVLDKTGTLTQGRPQVMEIVPCADLDEATCLTLAAAAEAASEHPLARAIVRAAQERGLSLPAVTAFQTATGKGVTAVVQTDDGAREVRIGSPQYLRDAGLSLQDDALLDAQAQAGRTPLLLAVDGRVAAVLALADALRPEAREVLDWLRTHGVRPVMLTGDARRTALAVARELGLPEGDVMAEVLPEGKAAAVAQWQQGGALVGMVGDGVNDAPALATADVGLAMGSGVDVAVETGDVVLLGGGAGGGLRSLVTALRLSRATRRNILQNLGWAFGYNILGIPVAAGLLHAFGGPTLSPMLAGAAMALSSVSVVSNALRLRWVR